MSDQCRCDNLIFCPHFLPLAVLHPKQLTDALAIMKLRSGNQVFRINQSTALQAEAAVLRRICLVAMPRRASPRKEQGALNKGFQFLIAALPTRFVMSIFQAVVELLFI